MKTSSLFFYVFVVSVIGGAGCADSRPTISCSVKGLVTVDGEDLIEGGTVNFISSSTGDAAIGDVGPDGTFVIVGGMVPGTYQVTVTPPTPTPDFPEVKESRVPQKYRDVETSDLKSEIVSGSNDLKFELKS